jgi:amidohydrolase
MSRFADTWKQRIVAAVDELRDELLALSHAIHADPELAFKEHRASARLAEALERAGFRVERGVGGLETAFRAELVGEGPGPTVAILAEYDALPDVGHGCGHNIIATSALGAGLALARSARNAANGATATPSNMHAAAATAVSDPAPAAGALAQAPDGRSGHAFAGRVLVIGTPAEEGGGGKILLAEAGIFKDVDAAMMIHPSHRTLAVRGSLAHSRVDLTFHGKAAHAASAPDQGINALDAVIQTFNAVNAARLHMRLDARVHGIITQGGDAVNIVPSRASASFSVRARDRAYQRVLVDVLRRAAEGAALATGARLEWTERRGYDNMIPNPTLGGLFKANLESLGVPVDAPREHERMGSTDMGDISQILPGLHAYVAIGPEDMPGHSTAFAEASISEAGDAAVLNSAKALALTAADLLAEPALVQQAQREFKAMVERGEAAGWDAWREQGRQYAGFAD